MSIPDEMKMVEAIHRAIAPYLYAADATRIASRAALAAVLPLAYEKAAGECARKAREARQMSYDPAARNIVAECYEDAEHAIRNLAKETSSEDK